MQTLDCVSGLHNCLEYSQLPLVFIDESMETQKKSPLLLKWKAILRLNGALWLAGLEYVRFVINNNNKNNNSNNNNNNNNDNNK